MIKEKPDFTDGRVLSGSERAEVGSAYRKTRNEVKEFMDKAIQKNAPKGAMTSILVHLLHDFKCHYDSLPTELKQMHHLE